MHVTNAFLSLAVWLNIREFIPVKNRLNVMYVKNVFLNQAVWRRTKECIRVSSQFSGGKIRFDLGEIATELIFTPKCSEKSA